MKMLRHVMATFMIVVMAGTSYAATIENTKAIGFKNPERAKEELVKGLDRAIRKEQKKPTPMSEVIAKAERKIEKNYNKMEDMLGDIFKHDSQEKQLKALDRRVKKLVKADPSLASMVGEDGATVELLKHLEAKQANLESEKQLQVDSLHNELSKYASAEDYLVELKSKVESDSLASVSKDKGRSIAAIDELDIILALYVLSALLLVWLIYYLIVASAVAIWAFSPALAILFLIIML